MDGQSDSQKAKKIGKYPAKPEHRRGLRGAVRTYLSIMVMLHKDMGVLRVVGAYLFLIFAITSLAFTIKLPVSTHLLPPTTAEKVQSRIITGFMTMVNLIVYGIIMNWTKRHGIRMAIRLAFIGTAFYVDMFLVRIIYIMVREGVFF